jgi:hypothetical protein
MRRLILAAVCAAFLTSTVARAAEEVWRVARSSLKFTSSGETVELDALDVNGDVYVKLRDIANWAGINILYDDSTKTVKIVNPPLVDHGSYSF